VRIMFLGDVHGNRKWVRNVVLPKAEESGVELILQLGDFGFMWPGNDEYGRLSADLETAGIPMWFVDGNHDDHERLRKLVRSDEKPGVPLSAETPNIRYLPRGERFTLDGVSFLALGGAYSIDKEYRTPYVSWWPEEEITYAEADRAIDGGKVTVMLTHDLPLGVELTWDRKRKFWEAEPNRKMVRGVIDEVRPKWCFHGHLHWRQTTLLPLAGGHMVRVESLNCDSPHDEHGVPVPDDHNWIIRDTAELSSITRDLDMRTVVRAVM
jgi:predicted phosphodiesterase